MQQSTGWERMMFVHCHNIVLIHVVADSAILAFTRPSTISLQGTMIVIEI